ncbi:MAG TPA: SulP family inorganic anion transporter [Ktedonobacterales bacterium]|nr:SulP family inorganic anion transporter [Ktedonobacterales bacterium]
MAGNTSDDHTPNPAPRDKGGAQTGRPTWPIERAVPGVAWIRAYRRADLRHDLIAGLTLAAVILPIAMAYGQLAGLPPIAGVYASILPLVAYALFGSSPRLIIGPDASTAALVAAAILPLAGANSAHAMALAAGLALLVGLMSLAAGFARLGFIADFLSKPILVGYVIGLALTIIAGQLGKVFGIPIASDDFFRQIAELVMRLPETNLPSLAIGASVLALIVILRRVAPRVPAPLLAVVGATIAANIFHLDARGVATIGAIPPGLPAPRIPPVSLGELAAMLPGALGITLLTFSDTILNARTFATRQGVTVHASGELIGLGAGNLAAGLTQGFPVSGSGTRTAVNEAAGGRTQLAGVLAALTLSLILVFLTDPLSHFPTAALGGALIAVVLPLLDAAELRHLYYLRRRESAVALVTTLSVLTVGLLPGLAIAVTLSFLLLLARAVRPHDAVLGKIPGLDGYHDIGDYPESERAPGLLVYRFDGPLFFANASYFKSRVLALAEELDPPLRWFILDAEAITDIDSTALEALEEVRQRLTVQGAVFAIARAKSALRERLERAGLADAIGLDRIYPSIRTAVAGYAADIGDVDSEP